MGAQRLKYCIGTLEGAASIVTLASSSKPIHPFFLPRPACLPLKSITSYHSTNQRDLWAHVRSYFFENEMLFPADPSNQDLAGNVLTLMVQVFWEISPYSTHFLPSSSLSKANSMSPILTQFFGFRQVGENVLVDDEAPPAGWCRGRRFGYINMVQVVVQILRPFCQREHTQVILLLRRVCQRPSALKSNRN